MSSMKITLTLSINGRDGYSNAKQTWVKALGAEVQVSKQELEDKNRFIRIHAEKNCLMD